jgi:hypothetical protein
MADEKKNTGRNNTGSYNTGNDNTGNMNLGNKNTGNSNTGSGNTGVNNSGGANTGCSNGGHYNTGDWNDGNHNTGFYNAGSRWSGFFCTGVATPFMFNKPVTDMTIRQIYLLVPHVDLDMVCNWVTSEQMTEHEKKQFPHHAVIGGCLRKGHQTVREGFRAAWEKMDVATKRRFLSLPNFDAKIFEECVGVNVLADEELFPPTPAIAALPTVPEFVVVDGRKYKLVEGESDV